MDPSKYWMLTRRKLGADQTAPPIFSTPHVTVGGGGAGSSVSYYESWEERAFAEDSARNLGGCIWPPRSYSCSFCGREFRSAQALGGHMNVHRRDRARLKLSGMREGDGSDHGMPLHQGYMIQPCPPKIGAPQHAQGPKPSTPSTDGNPNSIRSVLSIPSSSLVDTGAVRTVWGKQVLTSPLASASATQEYGGKEMFFRAAQVPRDHLNKVSRLLSEQELRAGSGEVKLSFLGCRTRNSFESDQENDDEKTVHLSRKRRKTGVEVTPLILCSSSGMHLQLDDHDDRDQDAKLHKICPSSPAEELDLELKL
ncbi:unnamed protein product [Alopecurus aequalis]